MMPHIESTRLQFLLDQRREPIGFGHHASHLTAFAEGAFLILTALTTSMGFRWDEG